jgi:hypothetical protein
VDVSEIHSLIEKGKLRALCIGSNVRIPEPELEKLLITCAAGPTIEQTPHSAASGTSANRDNTRLVATRTGRATFRVSGSVASGAEIWPGNMRYPIKLPKSFMDALLSNFKGEVAVGGRFDHPVRGRLGEFVQQKLKTKMNPAVYVAALLIDEGYAEASRRGYIRFRSRGSV